MLIFFTIVFTLYFLINLYLFLKGYRVMPETGNFKKLYLIIFILLAATFITGKVLERNHSTIISDVMNIIGGFWLAFMLYGFLFFLLSDIFLPVLRISGIISADSIPLYRKWSYITVVTLSVLFIAGGFLNAVIPVVREYNIKINKPAGDTKNFRIAAVSDIHLGSIIRKRSMKKLSEMLRDADPDIVFLLGDIVDGEIGPVLRDDLLSYFSCPECRNGVLAITGNHEFIGGSETTIPYIEKNGIRILKDEITEVEGGIQIIGRLDRDGARFTGSERKSLDSLMTHVDTSRPVILLDHQPLQINESARLGVDLQLSGHTHNGQMWPLNYITRLVYDVSYGYAKRGSYNIIVSSGFGLWGPRVRSGSRSEVLVINLSFRNDNSV